MTRIMRMLDDHTAAETQAILTAEAQREIVGQLSPDDELLLTVWRDEVRLCDLLLADDDGLEPRPRATRRHEYLAATRARREDAKRHRNSLIAIVGPDLIDRCNVTC